MMFNLKMKNAMIIKEGQVKDVESIVNININGWMERKSKI
mgnify:CR=1 FL=1